MKHREKTSINQEARRKLRSVSWSKDSDVIAHSQIENCSLPGHQGCPTCSNRKSAYTDDLEICRSSRDKGAPSTLELSL